MRKWSSFVLCLASLMAFAPYVRAQAIYTASRTTRIQAGAGATYLSPDAVDKSIKGASVWADYDFSKYVGLEAEVRLGNLITPDDVTEISYFVGPRFLYRRKALTIYGKAAIGRATIASVAPNNSSSSGYNAFAYGGGVEYKFARKFNLRAIDFELQQWPNYEPHTLSPTLITIGLSYIIK